MRHYVIVTLSPSCYGHHESSIFGNVQVKEKVRNISCLLLPTPDLRPTSFHIQLVPAVLSLRFNWQVEKNWHLPCIRLRGYKNMQITFNPPHTFMTWRWLKHSEFTFRLHFHRAYIAGTSWVRVFLRNGDTRMTVEATVSRLHRSSFVSSTDGCWAYREQQVSSQNIDLRKDAIRV